ncbi:MAG: hypothetical protein HY903_05690 [Deltaproteobacteria bacterium]|nr:hypothetical protein [Deltaproteobacteria bacterium]
MSEYRLHDPEKGLIGPVRLETVKDLIAAGVVHEQVVVSKDDGPFQPISAFAEIVLQRGPGTRATPQPTYSGDLGKNTFFKVFYRFHVTHANGLLTVVRDQHRKDVYLQDGVPTYITSNIESDRLGEFLVARGFLELDELNVALQSMHDDDNRLGQTLVRLGLIEPEELLQALRTQQFLRLTELCSWEWGRYLFYDGMRFTGDKIDLQLNVPELIIQAARSLPLPRLESRLAPAVNTVVEKLPHQVIATEVLQFSAFEARVQRAVDGKRTLASIVNELGVDAEHRKAVLMVIYLLWEIDAVGFRRP